MLDNIEIILLNTSHPGNIGATARAMKNMGLRKLKLVNPKFLPNEESKAMAANATDILANVEVFDSLEEAIKDCNVIYGTTGRDYNLNLPKIEARDMAAEVFANASAKVGILFGAERTGLTRDELIYCDKQVYIQANPEYCSLNLAQAVQIVGYELYHASVETGQNISQIEEKTALPNKQAVNYFYKSLEELLISNEILNPAEPGNLMARLRQVFTRACIDEKELNILQGIISKLRK